MTNQECLTTEATQLLAVLQRAGHEAFLVGGCVRDRLLGLPIKDIDIATSARPEQIERIFPGSHHVGAAFGVSLVKTHHATIEVATFRRDGVYIDHRHPETVSYGTQQDDARRRDFTINALFEDPVAGNIVDLVGGMEDLRLRILRCVGEPCERFREDALRMLRAIRFACRLGFQMEPRTWEALCELAHTIEYISPERHRDELTGILTGPAPGRALRLLADSGLLRWLLPEVEAMIGVEQGREFHPEGDVFVHTALVMEKLEPRTPQNAWAALLHDVGKAPTFSRVDGRITFREHERVGAEMARGILARLRFSNDFSEAVASVVKRHMTFSHIHQMKESTLRRFLAAETIESDLAVHRADCLGSHGRLDAWEFVRHRRAELAAAGESPVPPSLITGHDLIAQGLQPGPQFARILEAIQEKQLEGTLTTREEALAWIARNGQ